jgi:predicted TPR repeat methyltransferase
VDAQATAQLQRPLLLYRRAFASKRSGRFAEAIAGFSECLSLDPGDEVAARQLAACRAAVAASQS